MGWLFGGILLDLVGNLSTVLIGAAGGWAILLIALAASKELRRAK